MTLIIREEEPTDIEEIYTLTKLAFHGREYADGDEQDVINRLRDQDVLSLSLVAASSDGELLGQITFSPVELDGQPSNWYALGPVSVAPLRQSEGIGGQLINEGLRQIQSWGAFGCILTGNPVYYERFGFEVMPEHAPANEPGEYFQIRTFTNDPVKGTFTFHPAFYETS